MSNGDIQQQLTRAQELLRKREFRAALEILIPLVERYPNHRDVLYLTALCYESGGNPDTAKRVTQRLLTIEDDKRSQVLAQRLGLKPAPAPSTQAPTPPAAQQSPPTREVREAEAIALIERVAREAEENKPDQLNQRRLVMLLLLLGLIMATMGPIIWWSLSAGAE